MVCCRKARSHYLSQCWRIQDHYVASPGLSGLIDIPLLTSVFHSHNAPFLHNLVGNICVTRCYELNTVYDIIIVMFVIGKSPSGYGRALEAATQNERSGRHCDKYTQWGLGAERWVREHYLGKLHQQSNFMETSFYSHLNANKVMTT